MDAANEKRVERMSRRRRVMNAVDHLPVDRMPIDLGMHYSTGISAFAYRDLRRHLGLEDHDVEVVDLWQFLARVEEDVLERFHCDCMVLHPGWQSEQVWNPRGDYRFRVPACIDYRMEAGGSWTASSRRTGEGAKRMPAGGFFFDGADVPLEDRTNEQYEAALAREARRIHDETDYYTMYIGFGGYFSDHPDWLCDMLLEPDKLHAQNKRALDAELKRAARYIDLLGDSIQGICIATDLGTQNAVYCKPQLYEDISGVYLKAFCDYIHANTDWKVFMHSCGSMEPMIDILVRCGVDVLNPVQISARNMQPEVLMERHGRNITFWGGGCDTQNVLGRKKPEDVRQNVRDLLGAFGAKTGFVFNQVHNVMGDVPPENVVAMLDAAYECAWGTNDA